MDGRDLVSKGRSVGWWFALSDWLGDASQEDCPCRIPSFFFHFHSSRRASLPYTVLVCLLALDACMHGRSPPGLIFLRVGIYTRVLSFWPISPFTLAIGPGPPPCPLPSPTPRRVDRQSPTMVNCGGAIFFPPHGARWHGPTELGGDATNSRGVAAGCGLQGMGVMSRQRRGGVRLRCVDAGIWAARFTTTAAGLGLTDGEGWVGRSSSVRLP
jgi:hypothetical protein